MGVRRGIGWKGQDISVTGIAYMYMPAPLLLLPAGGIFLPLEVPRPEDVGGREDADGAV